MDWSKIVQTYLYAWCLCEKGRKKNEINKKIQELPVFQHKLFERIRQSKSIVFGGR